MTVPLLEETPAIQYARDKWQYRGDTRPPFAVAPGDGQESVWDYPRPPASVPFHGLVEVRIGGELVVSTRAAIRVLETAGAPTFYVPPGEVKAEVVGEGPSSVCEWKGLAESLTINDVRGAAWRYVQMFPAFASLYGWIAFYPAVVECFVDGEAVLPQAGGYYGGWVTSSIVGPVKGEPGTNGL